MEDNIVDIKDWFFASGIANVPEDYLGAAITALYEFNDYDALFLWLHFFMDISLRNIEKQYNISIAKQRLLYDRYRKRSKYHLQRYQKRR